MLPSHPMQDAIIRLEGLVKNYGSVQALDGITCSVPGGPVGLLGPNGAGKTTLIKLLLGLLEPSSGRAEIAGFDPRSKRARLELRRSVGYMPESDCFLPGVSAVEIVATLGRITGMPLEDAMTRAHEVLDYVGLDEARYRELDQYSTGMKQRLKLAQALVHDPPILLLDEPTNGLDPKGRKHMLELVYDLGHVQKKNVLLCSHLLPDVERTCDHVIVLHKGRAVKDGAIAELTRGDGRVLRVRVERASDAFAAALGSNSRKFTREEDGTFRVIVSADAQDADELFVYAASCGASLAAVDVVRSSLDEVFLKTLREASPN